MIFTYELKDTPHFDTSNWTSVCDLTLTLKQVLWVDCGRRVAINEDHCRNSFRHFMKLLNRKTYGNAFCRHGKRLQVIPILEKDRDGRFHYHVAIEPPDHIAPVRFSELVQECWSQTDWGYRKTEIRFNADQGWVDYMLKSNQKSGFEAWSDCIDWNSFYNPIADA
jgi:hypothetical protein